MNLWFRNRRVSDKRRAKRNTALVLLGIIVALASATLGFYIRTNGFKTWAAKYHRTKRNRAEIKERRVPSTSRLRRPRMAKFEAQPEA